MKTYRTILLSVFGVSLFIPTVTSATNNYPTVAPLPDVVHVRKNCETLTDCGTTLKELQSWIDNYKQPSASAPLLVDIGPGTFNGSIVCNGYSNLSIKGAGQAQTIINGNSISVGASIFGINCTNLNVQDLTLAGTAVVAPASWTGSGSSTWANVEIKPVAIYAWTESGCPSDPAQAPVHRWFGSHLQGLIKTYEAQCSKSWFFGSQIEALPQAGGDVRAFVIHTANDPSSTQRPEVHVYGGNISVTLPAGASFNAPAPNGIGTAAVESGYNAMIHIHGTGIDVIGNTIPNSIAALSANGGGAIHADVSAYNLSTGTGGTVARILTDTNPATHVHAPYQWQHIPSFPLASINGADITTVTTGTSDGQPHMVIYSSSCTSKWYDTTDKVCRP